MAKVQHGPIILSEIIPDYAIDTALDNETKKRLNILRDYDLSFLTNEFQAKNMRQFSPEQLFPLVPYFRRYKLTVDRDVSERLAAEFKRFVAVALVRPSRRNAPSGPVDMFWHFFILHTPEYVEFCTAIFGEYGDQPRAGRHYFTGWQDKRASTQADHDAFVDHIPATDETRPAMFKSYMETRAIYEGLFGTADVRFWPTRAGSTTCGDSYSGFVNPKFKRTPALEEA